MYEEQQLYNDLVYVMFYGGITFLALVAGVYMLFRRGNAIAPEITPPLRLRRWTAAFFALVVLGHVWWALLTCFHVISDPWIAIIVGAGLDCLTLVPVLMVTLLAMLQDRRRPLWPVVVAQVPVAVILVACIIYRDYVFVSYLRMYILLFGIVFMITMAQAVRQYGRWLRDNYADLEHKEVWQSFVAIFVCWLILCFYIMIDNSRVFAYIVHVNDIVLISLLLWRVETLQRLDEQDDTDCHATPCEAEKPIPSMALSAKSASSIGQLLEQHCEATHLYLRHDIRLGDLSKAIGTNRSYLSQYFAQQHTTYNAYINNLRIEHFIRLYRESVDSGHPFTAQQLAQQSGFRSYSTFGMAFKQRMGQTVTAWMRDIDGR
jgi:AraC-like DNA-binding protein